MHDWNSVYVVHLRGILFILCTLYLDPREDTSSGHIEVEVCNQLRRWGLVWPLQLLPRNVVRLDDGRNGLGVQEGSCLLVGREGGREGGREERERERERERQGKEDKRSIKEGKEEMR